MGIIKILYKKKKRKIFTTVFNSNIIRRKGERNRARKNTGERESEFTRLVNRAHMFSHSSSSNASEMTGKAYQKASVYSFQNRLVQNS